MKKIQFTVLFGVLFTSFASQAQTKVWTLEEAVEYAIKNNISVQQTNLDLRSADIDKKDAWGQFLPSINANASHSWSIGLNQNITTGLLENQTNQFTSAGLSVGVDLFNGLQNQNRLRKSNLSILASQYKLAKIKDDVALNVASAYLQILFNKENLKVQKELLVSNNRELNRTTQLVEAGSIARGDLLDMKATVASGNQLVVSAENSLLISKLSLAQLLQLEDFKDFDVAELETDAPLSEVMLQSAEAIYSKAKEERVELKIARTNLEIAERDIKIAKGNYMPTLGAFYNFNTRAAYLDRVVGFTPDPDSPTTVIGVVEGTNQNVLAPNFNPVLGSSLPIFDQFNDNKGHSFGFQLTIPILNGFAVRNSVDRAKIAVDRFKIAYTQEELDLERNVYTAFSDAKGALNSYEAAVAALESRELAFEYARERYNVGMMNAFDFNQAQTLLANAQSEVIRAKYDYIFRVKVVEFYFGIPIRKN